MVYDRSIIIYTLEGTPLKGVLTEHSRHFCAPKTVAHRRYWQAVQADTRIDADVQIPYGLNVDSSMFAMYDGGLYRIEEAQHAEDADELPVTNLSLRKWKGDFKVVNTASSGD